jgi:hypothetical protein
MDDVIETPRHNPSQSSSSAKADDPVIGH